MYVCVYVLCVCARVCVYVYVYTYTYVNTVVPSFLFHSQDVYLHSLFNSVPLFDTSRSSIEKQQLMKSHTHTHTQILNPFNFHFTQKTAGTKPFETYTAGPVVIAFMKLAF